MPRDEAKPTIIITGCSGLIGRRICRQLSDDYQIVGLDIREPQGSQLDLTWIECDMTESASVQQALSDVAEHHAEELASVIHLAAYYDFSGEPSPLYEELTVAGTRRLLKGLDRFKVVEQFVFSSSLLVMQPCELGQRLDETHPTHAEWEYPESKLRAEEVIRQSHGSIPAVILRVAGVYDEDGHSLPITQNVRRIAERQLESYFFPGDAERGQAFVHLEDLARCFLQVVQKRKQLEAHEVFLIAEDECLSYEELQDMIGELLHGTEDWPTIRIPKPLAKAGAWVKERLASSDDEQPFIKPWMVDLADAHYPVDNSRARTQLGWRPPHRLSGTLPEMIRRLKQNPRKWYEKNALPLPDDFSSLEKLEGSATAS